MEIAVSTVDIQPGRRIGSVDAGQGRVLNKKQVAARSRTPRFVIVRASWKHTPSCKAWTCGRERSSSIVFEANLETDFAIGQPANVGDVDRKPSPSWARPRQRNGKRIVGSS